MCVTRGRMNISTEQIICSLCAGFNNRFISHGFFDSRARSIIEDRQEIAQLAGARCSIIEQEALTQASLRFPLRHATPG